MRHSLATPASQGPRSATRRRPQRHASNRARTDRYGCQSVLRHPPDSAEGAVTRWAEQRLVGATHIAALAPRPVIHRSSDVTGVPSRRLRASGARRRVREQQPTMATVATELLRSGGPGAARDRHHLANCLLNDYSDGQGLTHHGALPDGLGPVRPATEVGDRSPAPTATATRSATSSTTSRALLRRWR